jgi:pyocin large subunit-like protein
MGQGGSGRVSDIVDAIMNTPGWEARLASEYAGEPYVGARTPQVDFRDAKGNSTLSDHFINHGKDYATEEEYNAAATRFLEKQPTPTTQSFVSDEGTYFRYDTATNEFGIINRYGGISTYYKPDTQIKYWVEQVVKYAPQKGRAS